MRQETALSLVVIAIRNFEALKEKIGVNEAGLLLHELTRLVKQSLRRKSDRAVGSRESIMVLLPLVGKEDALIVGGRARQVVEEYLIKRGFAQLVKVSVRVATFPDDGRTTDEILKRAFA